MVFICSECHRIIDPNVVHWEDGVPLPDGMGFELKDPKHAMYNLCYDCICKLGEGKIKTLNIESMKHLNGKIK